MVALFKEAEPTASSAMLLDRGELDLTGPRFSRDGYDRPKNTVSLSRVGRGAIGTNCVATRQSYPIEIVYLSKPI